MSIVYGYINSLVFSSTYCDRSSQSWTPEYMYGVTKVAVERFGSYLKKTCGFDFRCLRFPMVLSPFAPLSAKTAYPSHACRAVVLGDAFNFQVSKETGMSCMFLDDVIRSILEISHAPQAGLKSNAYNLHLSLIHI